MCYTQTPLQLLPKYTTNETHHSLAHLQYNIKPYFDCQLSLHIYKTNKTHSLAYLQDLTPILAAHYIAYYYYWV